MARGETLRFVVPMPIVIISRMLIIWRRDTTRRTALSFIDRNVTLLRIIQGPHAYRSLWCAALELRAGGIGRSSCLISWLTGATGEPERGGTRMGKELASFLSLSSLPSCSNLLISHRHLEYGIHAPKSPAGFFLSLSNPHPAIDGKHE